MPLWIKICGNTSLADAQLAVDAGADAVGFVFAPSPRQVTPEQVAGIAPHLPASIEAIGVFVDAEFDAARSTVERCGLTGVQLHSGGYGDLPRRLRSHFGAGLRILRVIHFGKDAARQLEAARADAAIDGVLVDSRTPNAVGGTGIAFDWEAARTTIFSGEHHLRLIAAGGLTPANVAEVIAVLQPWGVDAVSSLESTPGRKDPLKVREFVANARAAVPSAKSLEDVEKIALPPS